MHSLFRLGSPSVILYVVLFAIAASAYSQLSNDSLASLPRPGLDLDIRDGALLAPILIPRVPGTEGSQKVQRHFLSFFRNVLPEWKISHQNSTQETPDPSYASTTFTNLVFTRDPPWAENKPGEVDRLTFVAHYDSKLYPLGFVGAVDSAAPCAMLMHIARSIDNALTRKWKSMQEDIEIALTTDLKGVQIIFMDGEESFVRWTDSDSLYGARSLAENWENTYYPPMSSYKNPLNSIDLFVLLDLLGSRNPRVPSYFKVTHWAYRNMANIERRLRGLQLFKSAQDGVIGKENKGASEFFLHEIDKDTCCSVRGFVMDDHVPFMVRGVHVLHIIPSPFPSVWHNMDDDGKHLDLDTVEDWAVLVTAFAAEWMELEGFF